MVGECRLALVQKLGIGATHDIITQRFSFVKTFFNYFFFLMNVATRVYAPDTVKRAPNTIFGI